MVGVPGKSKGCLTCRRRKIRCDESKPNCHRCTSSSRACEGYETFPTFLISTPEGRQKRKHLAEAKPRSESNEPTSASSTGALSSRRTSIQFPSRSKVTVLPKQPSNGEVYDVQLISTFWYKYVPTDVSASSPSPAPWVQALVLRENAGPTLSLSLKAFALTRLGWLDNNEALVMQGRQHYGLALGRLRRDLQLKDQVLHEDTLACTHCLSLYELYESDNLLPWTHHLSALGALIRMRGPDAYESDLARAALYGFAYSTMVQCLQFRRSTFLNSEEWRTRPWKNHQKDLQFKLLEFGFELGGCIEAADVKRAEKTFHHAEALTALHQIHDIRCRMQGWLDEFLLAHPNAIPTSKYPKTLHFRTLRIAISILLYWAINVILSYFVALIGENMAVHVPNFRSLPDVWANLSVGEILDLHSEDTCVEYSTNILRTMAYILRDDMGLMAAQQAIFPIRVALFHLRQRGGPEKNWAQDLYDQVIERKGLKYAASLSKTDGGYARDRKIREDITRAEASEP